MKFSQYLGTDAKTFAPLRGIAHLRQSIFDILMTRRGERVMRPDYGSNLFYLIDRPVNTAFMVDLYYEAVTAIHRWEPRVRITKVRADVRANGQIFLDLTVRVDGVEEDLRAMEIQL